MLSIYILHQTKRPFSTSRTSDKRYELALFRSCLPVRLKLPDSCRGNISTSIIGGKMTGANTIATVGAGPSFFTAAFEPLSSVTLYLFC